MKTKTFLFLSFLTLIFACNTEQDKIKAEVDSFKVFTDSLLLVNVEYIRGFDSSMVVTPFPNDKAMVIIDTIIKHSNLFDISQNTSEPILSTLEKYNTMEQHLDSEKAKMDAKTLELFESIKQKMNEIKQPIK